MVDYKLYRKRSEDGRWLTEKAEGSETGTGAGVCCEVQEVRLVGGFGVQSKSESELLNLIFAG